MIGGFWGNFLLFLITLFLLAIIFGLFFGVNVLAIVMEYVTIGLVAVIDMFTALVNIFV